MTGNNIFIVTVGELCEDGYVQSVHATLEGARGAVNAYLSGEEELNREVGPDLDPDFRWRRRGLKSRMELFRHALDQYLSGLGEAAAAARVRGA